MITITRALKLDKLSYRAVYDVLVDGRIQINSVRLMTNKSNEYYLKMPEEVVKGKVYPAVKIVDVGLMDEIKKVLIENYTK